MSRNDADRMANSVDPDQTASEESGSALFAQVNLSKNLRSLRYLQFVNAPTPTPKFASLIQYKCFHLTYSS